MGTVMPDATQFASGDAGRGRGSERGAARHDAHTSRMGSDPEATFLAEIALSTLHDIRRALAQLNSAAELAINVARREVQVAYGDDAAAADANSRIHAHLAQMWDRQRDVEALLQRGQVLARAREGSQLTLRSQRFSDVLDQALVVAERGAPSGGRGFAVARVCRSVGELECDARLLVQAFANVLLDAAQFGCRDGREDLPCASVTCEQQPDHVLVTITHWGPPIPQKEREAIFSRPDRGAAEAGHLVAGRRRHFGLFIARRFFEQHGGTIVCASSRRMTEGPTPMSGAVHENVFEVRLPRNLWRNRRDAPATP